MARKTRRGRGLGDGSAYLRRADEKIESAGTYLSMGACGKAVDAFGDASLAFGRAHGSGAVPFSSDTAKKHIAGLERVAKGIAARCFAPGLRGTRR